MLKNQLVEKELLLLKEGYQKQEMSEEQIKRLKMKMEEAKLGNKKECRRRTMLRWTAAAAIFAGIFLILPNTSVTIAHAMEQIPILGQLVEVVTFRDYKYETDRNKADIEVPQIQVPVNQTQEKLSQTTDEINAEIQQITDKLVTEFEDNLKNEMGYQDVVVTSEILTANEEYFTLKLLCYQGAGSGYQWNYYYTIDMNTGERLQLKDIFTDGADYITAISENIKKQMQEQMAADEKVYYWLNDEIEEWNFKSITDETNFYLNEKGNIVIGFDEGEVAPMYMGALEFEIPDEVLNDIRK